MLRVEHAALGQRFQSVHQHCALPIKLLPKFASRSLECLRGPLLNHPNPPHCTMGSQAVQELLNAYLTRENQVNYLEYEAPTRCSRTTAQERLRIPSSSNRLEGLAASQGMLWAEWLQLLSQKGALHGPGGVRVAGRAFRNGRGGSRHTTSLKGRGIISTLRPLFISSASELPRRAAYTHSLWVQVLRPDSSRIHRRLLAFGSGDSATVPNSFGLSQGLSRVPGSRPLRYRPSFSLSRRSALPPA